MSNPRAVRSVAGVLAGPAGCIERGGHSWACSSTAGTRLAGACVDLITRVAGNRSSDSGEQNDTLDGVRAHAWTDPHRLEATEPRLVEPRLVEPRLVERRRKTRGKTYREATALSIRRLGAIAVTGLLSWALILSSVFAAEYDSAGCCAARRALRR